MKKLLNSVGFICVVLGILCLSDTLATLHAVKNHLGYEANPIMAWVLSKGYLAFFLTKTAITISACTLFYYKIHVLATARFPQLGLRLVQVVTAVYLVNAIYHVIGLIWLC